MIRWDFWVSDWEHPFSLAPILRFSQLPPTVEVVDIPKPDITHKDFGPWEGPPPGPVKPGIPKEVIDWEARRLAAEGTAEYWWLDPRFAEKYADRGVREGERDDDRERDPQDVSEPREDPWMIGPYTDETVPQITKVF